MSRGKSEINEQVNGYQVGFLAVNGLVTTVKMNHWTGDLYYIVNLANKEYSLEIMREGADKPIELIRKSGWQPTSLLLHQEKK